MENNGILSWHHWSIVRRAATIGALVGAVVTLTLHSILLKAVEDSAHIARYREFPSQSEIVWALIILPSTLICNLLGIPGELFGWARTALAVIINAFLAGVFGILLGRHLAKKRANVAKL